MGRLVRENRPTRINTGVGSPAAMMSTKTPVSTATSHLGALASSFGAGAAGTLGSLTGTYLGSKFFDNIGRKKKEEDDDDDDEGYKMGGRVKKTGKALVHKGEFVLPRGVKPTKGQCTRVMMKRKRKNKV